MVLIICFKTRSPYFEKERDGLKCNTVRTIGEDDLRFDVCMSFIQGDNLDAEIVITNPQTEEKFRRKITDITYYDERFIISWKHDTKDINSEPKEEVK